MNKKQTKKYNCLIDGLPDPNRSLLELGRARVKNKYKNVK